jgi:hypothetical protein
MKTQVLSVVLMALSLASGCGPGEGSGPDDALPNDGRSPKAIAQDLQSLGRTIDMHNLMSNEDMSGHQGVTVSQVQSFLAAKGSYLAGYTDPAWGRTAATLIVERSRAYRISPVYMLARIETESGLVRSGTSNNLSKATGCGCPDSGSCGSQYAGFGNQVECSAHLFRNYITEQETTGSTRSGWRVGVTKNTLDPCAVRPANQATAALYTYTPWVGAYGIQCGTAQWGGSTLVAALYQQFKSEGNWSSPPTLDVFVQATDSAIWRKQWTGSAWLNWESLGGVLGTAPASASMAPGTQHVYAVGTNGELFQKAWNGTAWSGWESLGGTAALSRPGAASMGPGLMHVFVRGTDNHLYQKYWTGNAWSAWENLDGQLLSGPSAVSMARGTVHVFARGPGNTLWMKYWTGSAWVGWEDLGGDLASGPGVVSMAPGTLHVFVRGSDNAVWMKYWTGSAWSAWENLGGDAVGDPWALSNEPGKLHVFTRATDGAAWQKTWNGSSWSGWMSLGGNLK